jgi:hypothetical protein
MNLPTRSGNLRPSRVCAQEQKQRLPFRDLKPSPTFVLQGSEIVANGNINATWFVVPGSETGDLAGLRGEGGFEGEFGKGSDGTLDYWFE